MACKKEILASTSLSLAIQQCRGKMLFDAEVLKTADKFFKWLSDKSVVKKKD